MDSGGSSERQEPGRVSDSEEANSIIERLFEFDETGKSKQGYRFNFFWAVYLLENLYHQQLSSKFAPPGEEGPLNQERLRFRPSSGLGFPASDILRIEREMDEQVQQVTEMSEIIRLTLSFMGLYGVNSPLPTYFSELIIAEELEPLKEKIDGKERNRFPLRDFLDIFNHRLYSFFYRIWKKYRYYLQFSPDGKDIFSQYMLSLFGLGLGMEDIQKDLQGLETVRLIAYAGILGLPTRCAEGLRWVLSDYFGGISVKIVEFIPHWVDIDKRYRISLQSKHDSPPPKLGENVTIGGKICDYSGKFRVVLGPLNLEAFRSFLPGGTNAEALHSLVQFYAPDFLDFDVELVLRKEDVPELKLGEKQAPLGQICWLGRPSSDVSVVLYYRR